MTRSRRIALLLAALILAAGASLGLRGCAGSTHAAIPSNLGTPRRFADLEAIVDQPGPIEVETIVSTKWVAPRSGLINLDAPAAKAAGLKDGEEPIEIFFHAVRHPQRGTFIIDTGVSRAMRDTPNQAAVRGVLASMLNCDRMTFEMPLGDWLATQPGPIRGVFFTHVALDHITGAPDLPKDTPLYAGPGDTRERALLYLEPGTFNSDRAGNANSLSRLRRFAREHPKMEVRLGHQ